MKALVFTRSRVRAIRVMMFGFACKDTSVYMPAPIYYAHLLAKKLTDVRKSEKIAELSSRWKDPGYSKV